MCEAVSQSPIVSGAMDGNEVQSEEDILMYAFALALKWYGAMVIIQIRRWLAYVKIP